METRKVFTTYVNGKMVYSGDSQERAIRIWDAATYSLGKSIPGGISVQEFSGDLMVRDGWILHIHNDGTVYLNPSI